MKSERNILIAFLLNFLFSIVELVGGLLTGSIAIISDSLHDFGDAFSIAVSAYLERKSKRPPDEKYTFGYSRFSVIGGAMNALILILGSITVIYGAVNRLIAPSPIHYDGMIVMAVIGVAVNLLAAFVTHGGHSTNEKAVSLHMMEDVLGWAVVLVGAVVMRFTNWWFLDPIMSICVAVFIFISAVKVLNQVLTILLEKAPSHIEPQKIAAELQQLEGVSQVHHIHLWSLDEDKICATVHIVVDGDNHLAKESVRNELARLGIHHATIETENPNEECHGEHCSITDHHGHHHHHHHHHH